MDFYPNAHGIISLSEAKHLNKETKVNPAKNLHTLRQELEAELTPKINIPIENKNDGRIAIITKKGIEKIESDKAIQKSIANGFSKQEHLTIAKRLDELYQNSVFKETHKDKNGVENIQIHRYISRVDHNTEALITLKETKEGKYQGNRIYTLELDSVARLSGSDSTTQATRTRGLDSGTNGLFIEQPPTFLPYNPTQKTLTRQEADELFSHFQQANKNYAQIKESLNDKFAKALTKGMNKKDLDSRLTIEQWKQRVLDTQWGDSVKGLENTIFKNFNPRMQKHTQMLTILRALDRNVKLNDDSMPIDFTKILSEMTQKYLYFIYKARYY